MCHKWWSFCFCQSKEALSERVPSVWNKVPWMTEYEEPVPAELHPNPEANHSVETPEQITHLQLSTCLLWWFFPRSATSESRTCPPACWIIQMRKMTREKMEFGSYQLFLHCWCCTLYSHYVTSNTLTSSKQVKHKRSTLHGTSSKVFKFKKLSPKVSASVLPSRLPVPQGSQRKHPLLLAFHMSSLRELLLCFCWCCACFGSISPGGSTTGGCQKSNPQCP